MKQKPRRGFAAMDPGKQREIARMGGIAVSLDSQHMAEIGRIGGKNTYKGILALKRATRKGK